MWLSATDKKDAWTRSSIHPLLPSAPKPQTNPRDGTSPIPFSPPHTNFRHPRKFKPERPNRKTFLAITVTMASTPAQAVQVFGKKKNATGTHSHALANPCSAEIEVLTRFACSRRARGGRQGGTHATAVPLSTGGALQRPGQHRRGGQLQLRGALGRKPRHGGVRFSAPPSAFRPTG